MLIKDVHLLSDPAGIEVLDTVPGALTRLRAAGFLLIVVSNQPIVARGLLDESGVEALHREVERRLVEAGAPRPDGFYLCPHHPKATLETYRKDCECRKPRPGMLLKAAADHRLSLDASFMVGDRITDIVAGRRAGARTVMVRSGEHLAPPITTSEPLDPSIRPDHVCDTLAEAAEWIIAQPPEAGR